jgi:hypothetical protein
MFYKYYSHVPLSEPEIKHFSLYLKCSISTIHMYRRESPKSSTFLHLISPGIHVTSSNQAITLSCHLHSIVTGTRTRIVTYWLQTAWLRVLYPPGIPGSIGQGQYWTEPWVRSQTIGKSYPWPLPSLRQWNRTHDHITGKPADVKPRPTDRNEVAFLPKSQNYIELPIK